MKAAVPAGAVFVLSVLSGTSPGVMEPSVYIVTLWVVKFEKNTLQ